MSSQVIRNPWVQRIVFLAIILVAWQLFGESVSPIIFSPPTRVVDRFYQLWVSGPLAFDTLVTIQTILISFVSGLIVAIPMGLAMGRIRLLEYALDPYITLIYATPTVAVIPLVIIWFGSNLSASYILVLLHVIPPILINTMIGVKVVSKTLVETGQSFGFRGMKLWRKVVLPASFPYIMAGLRIGMGAAVIGTMVAEIFMFTTGIGYILVFYASQFDSAAIISGVLIIMALGILLTELIKFLEHRLAKWSVSATGVR